MIEQEIDEFSKGVGLMYIYRYIWRVLKDYNCAKNGDRHMGTVFLKKGHETNGNPQGGGAKHNSGEGALPKVDQTKMKPNY